MTTSLLQPSFNAGELSPALYARTDLSKYGSGLRQCKNFVVRSTGGIEKRPGFEYLGTAKTQCRVIPFEVSQDLAYVIEVGDQYLRVYHDNYRVASVELVTPWTAADLPLIAYTQSADVMTLVHPKYAPRELRRYSETDWRLVTPTFENGPFRNINTDTSTLVYASAETGTITLTSTGSIFKSGHAGTLFRLEEENLGEIKPWEADKLLVSAGVNTYGILRRNDGKVYKCVTHATGGSGSHQVKTGTIGPTHDHGIRADGDGEPSYYGSTQLSNREGVDWEYLHSGYGIVRIDTITDATHAQGRVVRRLPSSCVGGSIQVFNHTYQGNGYNARFFLVGASANAATETVQVNGTGISVTNYSLGPEYAGNQVTVTLNAAQTGTISVKVAGTEQYALQTSSTTFSFDGGTSVTPSDYVVEVNGTQVAATVTIGSQQNGRALTLVNIPAASDTITVTQYANPRQTSIWAFGSWNDEYGWPSVVTYFGDRLTFGRTQAQPQTTWMSTVSDYHNFGKSTPVQDSDRIEFTINARQVNDVRDMIPLADMILLSSGGEWRMRTTNGVVSPSTISLKPQSFRGAAPIRAEIVGDSAIYVQAQQRQVRDLKYSFSVDAYHGNNLSELADHLFQSHQIVEIAFQQSPYEALWCVRDDGVLLSLTYLPEQQVYGWSRHITQGKVESIAVIPESGQNRLYAVIQRTVNGTAYRYIERLHSRFLGDINEAFYVDAGLTFDGRNQAGTLTIAAPNGATVNDVVNVTLAGASISLDANAEGDEFEINGTRLRILQVSTPTTATAVPLKNLPASVIGVNPTWSIRRNTIAGLNHLEGETVTALANGDVNSQATVTNGAITLDHPSSLVYVGLPYDAVMETLEINAPEHETIRDKHKIIPTVSLILRQSRSFWAGPDADSELYQVKQREYESYGQSVSLETGEMRVPIECNWRRTGRVYVQQTDPLPLTILGIIPEVQLAS